MKATARGSAAALAGLALALLAAPAAAQETGVMVVLRGTYDEDQYLAGGTVDSRAKVRGDVAAAGGQVSVAGEVSGDVLAAGGQVDLVGTVGDDVRAVAGQVRFAGDVGGDAVAAAASVGIDADATVGGRALLVGRLVDVAGRVGVTDDYDGRGVALVDLFNRGVLDVVVANQGQPVLVYRNTVASGGGRHWIAFKLVGSRSNRSAIGAEVLLEAGGARQLRVVDGGMGFASQNDRRPHFGLGATARVDRVEIRWPSGARQVLEHPEADRLHVVTEPPFP